MTRSLPITLPRFFIGLCLIALGIHSSARPAEASGCHAPDRPALGLIEGAPPDPAPVAGTFAFRKHPCPGDPAGSTSRPAPEVPEAALGVAGLAFPHLADWFGAPEPRPLARRPDGPPPDRPPRLA